MQARHRDFAALGAEVVAISSSGVDDHRDVAARIGASFPILADPEGNAIRAYGLLHPDALPGYERPVARPAVFVLDREGVIRERFLTDNWRVRARPERLLEAVRVEATDDGRGGPASPDGLPETAGLRAVPEAIRHHGAPPRKGGASGSGCK